jgi:hypothetical protein
VTYTDDEAGVRVTVDWPDTSFLIVAMTGVQSVRYVIWPAPAREGKLTGALGNLDGNPDNDVQIGSGTPIADTSGRALYPAYADSLRVSDATTLFTYAKGESTKTYTDRTFPDERTDPVPNTAWAEQVCRRYGITDAAALSDCITDMANTGSAEFLESALVTQQIIAVVKAEAGATLVHTNAGETTAIPVTAVAGQRFFVDVLSSTMPSSCGALTLKDPSGGIVASGCVIDGRGFLDTVTLPKAGTYSLVIDPAGGASADTWLKLVTPKDQQAAIAVDGPTVVAKVEQPGAQSHFTFSAKAGDKVFVAATVSTLPDRCGMLAIVDPAGHTLTSGCVIGGTGFVDAIVLPTTGSYALLVDPPANDVGEVTLRLHRDVDQIGTIAMDGAAVTATIAQPGAIARLSFPATAGQNVFVVASGSTLPDQCGIIGLTDATGAVRVSGCIIGGVGFIDTVAIEASGSYSIFVDPAATNTGSVQLKLIRAIDQAGGISINGSAVTATITQPGAVARFTFSGTAGQVVSLDVVSHTIPDECGTPSLIDPSGKSQIGGCLIGTSPAIKEFKLTASGTWTLLVDPHGADTGQVTLRLHT